MTADRTIDDRMERLVREANPVPDPDVLVDSDRAGEPSFEYLVDRYVAMTSLAGETNDPSRRPVALTLLAAAVLILVAGAVILLARVGGQDDPAPADQPEAPAPIVDPPVEDPVGPQSSAAEAIALTEDYIAARNERDVERALALMSDDFLTSERPPGYLGRATVGPAFEFDRIFETEMRNPSCRASGVDTEGVRVTCDIELSTVMHEAGGFLPEPRQLRAVIDRGQIVRTETVVDDGDPATMAAFDAWSSFLAGYPIFSSVVERAMQLDPVALEQLAFDMPRYREAYELEVLWAGE